MSPEQLHQSSARRTAIDGIHPKAMFDTAGAKVAIIGLDRAGLSLLTSAASRGFEVIGFDPDEVKIVQLEAISNEQEKKIPQKGARTISITSDESNLRDADIFIICTPAIPSDGRPDLEALSSAAAVAGRNLREGALVIVGSVVFPGVCEYLVLPILEKNSGLARPSPDNTRGEFFFAHVPNPAASAARPNPRVVGAPNQESLSRAAAFYHSIPGTGVRAMRSIKEAEAVRMVEDAVRDVNLALAGEFAMQFDRMGVDIVDVFKGVSPDAFDAAPLSAGVGNSRTPGAAYYIARSGHEHEIERQFVLNARRIIEHMPEYAVQLLSEALRENKIPLKGAIVALLGLSRVRDDSEAEDGVGTKIHDALARKGVIVKTYDPYLSDAGLDLKETLEGAQAAVIAGDHSMFANLTPRQFEEFGIFIVVDACNCLDKESFEKSPVLYRGIGRG